MEKYFCHWTRLHFVLLGLCCLCGVHRKQNKKRMRVDEARKESMIISVSSDDLRLHVPVHTINLSFFDIMWLKLSFSSRVPDERISFSHENTRGSRTSLWRLSHLRSITTMAFAVGHYWKALPTPEQSIRPIVSIGPDMSRSPLVTLVLTSFSIGLASSFVFQPTPCRFRVTAVESTIDLTQSRQHSMSKREGAASE